MKILLHTCCGPCLVYPLKVLREEGLEVVSYFYNPNIHPYQEYKRRLDTLKEYCAKEKVILIEEDYDVNPYFQNVVFNENIRCSLCYKLRVTRAAGFARSREFDGFSTTLLGSPYQDHELILRLGKTAEKIYDIPFIYRDFRKGYREGVEISKKLSLYRQKYCGCIYSERERFYPKARKEAKKKERQESKER